MPRKPHSGEQIGKHDNAYRKKDDSQTHESEPIGLMAEPVLVALSMECDHFLHGSLSVVASVTRGGFRRTSALVAAARCPAANIEHAQEGTLDAVAAAPTRIDAAPSRSVSG
jgi:hypothetical protein